MYKALKITLLFLCIYAKSSQVNAQIISGTVLDSENLPVPYASIQESGTDKGTSSDEDGHFSIEISSLPTTLIVSYVGFKEKNVDVHNSDIELTIVLEEDNVSLDEVLVLGNRAKPRTIIDSPVPIDNIGVQELQSTGQTTIAKMLTYSLPSYNSSTQAVSDGTAHFDPADIRGLGPSRSLVLINGKRKNQSALIYINDTPGKGEVGTDLKTIPPSAIENIEVLRDGASAQYGSDAIGGVINIVLKKDTNYTNAQIESGITSKGDGFELSGDISSGIAIGDKGYLNFSLLYSFQRKTNRPGSPGEDLLFDDLDSKDKEWIINNPTLGVTIGQPEMRNGVLYYNFGLPYSNGRAELYSFGGMSIRNGTSFSLYRTPYWPGILTKPEDNPLVEDGKEYNGFQPLLKSDIIDNFHTIGTFLEWGDQYKTDISINYGRNYLDYTIANTFNKGLEGNSPTSFKAGGFVFQNLVSNVDVYKSYGDLSVALGGEYRIENFIENAGEPSSYAYEGAESFPGLRPSNEVNKSRANIGVYLNADWDISEGFLIGGASRYEYYSDFGKNLSWKVNSRLKLGKNSALRGSYSTGFRAPSLHQIYFSNIQTLLTGGEIANQVTFNNENPAIEALGVPKLKAETSKNSSVGITLEPFKNFTITADWYNIKIDDRVLFTGEIGYKNDKESNKRNPVEEILDQYDVESLKFFINAVNTKTHGADLVISYKNIPLGAGTLRVTLSGNWNRSKIVGKIKTPEILEENDYDIFNRKEQSRILTARPEHKALIGLDYNYKNFGVSLNNNYFGEVTWMHAQDPSKDQTFRGKVLTDLIFNYKFNEYIGAIVNINNLFDVYPDDIDPKGDPTTNLGGRFKYPWEVNQFGFKGVVFNVGLNFNF